MSFFSDLARRLWPEPTPVAVREQLRACSGALLGIVFTALVSRWAAPLLHLNPWLVASMGASAVLVFALPSSPLAQPWPVVGGNLVAAASGLVCAWAVPDAALAAGCAVGLTILLMFRLRCLHPPGGGTAVLAVLMHGQQQHLALGLVLLNAALLVATGMVFNSLTGRSYPHGKPAAPPGPAERPSRFQPADLDAALAHFRGGMLGVSRDDLEELLNRAEAASFQRNLGTLRCQDIMTPDPVTGTRASTTADALQAMHSRGVKALPVVDAQQHLVGVVTRSDLLASDQTQGLGALMTRRVRVARADSPVMSLLQLFSEGGHHHIPIVDANTRVVGIITQSDFVRALHKAVVAG